MALRRAQIGKAMPVAGLGAFPLYHACMPGAFVKGMRRVEWAYPAMNGMAKMRFVIFANGEVKDGLMLRRALGAANATVVCADGGALHASRVGLEPDIIIGDMDSLTDEQLDAFERGGVAVMRLPPSRKTKPIWNWRCDIALKRARKP